MKNTIGILREIIQKGQDAVFVVIAESSGSTPRGAGASMVVTTGGRIHGTIGGGALEYRSEKKAQDVLSMKSSCTERYYLHENEVQDLGMICGGEVLVEFTYVGAGETDKIALLEKNENKHQKPGVVYIFGGGHISQTLVPILVSACFPCVILEDREDFCRPELFPGAHKTLLIDNGNINEYVTLSEYDYVVIVTRGHKDDRKIMAQALKTPAGYIGVIGSKRKAAIVFDDLRGIGYTDSDISRIKSPIGLDIGGDTPAEIAISIAAELISIRSGR